MKARTRIMIAAAAATLVAAGVLPAQEPEAAPEDQPRRMRLHAPGTWWEGGPAMRQQMRLGAAGLPGVHHFAPQALIARKDFLGLSEEQVAQLERLGEELTGTHEQALESAKASHEALLEAWQADRPDADAVRRYAEQAMQAQQAAHLAMLTGAAQAKALLTPEQQGKMQGWIEGSRMGMRMRAGRPGMRQGGRRGSLGLRRGGPGCQP